MHQVFKKEGDHLAAGYIRVVRSSLDGNTYITIPATYDGCKETPDELYEEGDEMLVYNLYDVLDNLIDLAITKYGWSPSVATAKRLDKEINTLRPFFQNIGA